MYDSSLLVKSLERLKGELLHYRFRIFEKNRCEILNRKFTYLKTFYVFAVVLILSACTPKGEEIDKQISDSHYYTIGKQGVIYGPMGNCFELGCELIEDADPNTFQPLDDVYALDANHVYHKHNILGNLKPESVRETGDGYLVAESIYYMGKRFEALHPPSFSLTSYNIDGHVKYYGRDKLAVYCGRKVISNDPANFTELIEKQNYFADSKDVYTMSRCVSLGADPDSFEFLNKPDGNRSVYAKDANKVFVLFLYNRELSEADAKTFRPLCSGVGPPHIAIDRSRVWDFGKLVAEANPKTYNFPEGCKP